MTEVANKRRAEPAAEQKPATEGEPDADQQLAMEADKYLEQYPDVLMAVGKNADGSAIEMSARTYLDSVREEAAYAREDIKLLHVAAGCLMGRT